MVWQKELAWEILSGSTYAWERGEEEELYKCISKYLIKAGVRQEKAAKE
jgi:hypothetical protein